MSARRRSRRTTTLWCAFLTACWAAFGPVCGASDRMHAPTGAVGDVPGSLQRTARTQRADLGAPDLGHVVLVFIATVSIGAAAVFALRRLPQKFWRRAAAAGAVRVLDHAALSATLRVYLVEIDHARFVITEGRSAVDVQVLSEPTASRRENVS